MELNQSQIEAIEHNKGPMLVLAGPGSGKTLVITRRTQELITTHGVKPEQILVITFSKAAAREMKERFCRLINRHDTTVNFGTFHAVFFKILKYAYGMDASNIIREEERYRFLREAVHDLHMELEDEKDFLDSVFSEISLVKNARIDIANYYSLSCAADKFKGLYKKYEDLLQRTNKIDFDDMLVLCHELFVQRPDILVLWQQKFEYILVDEFQDANYLQYEIVQMLAKPQDNLLIVGDDDQSIYRFRGAKPELMQKFMKDYPQAKKLLLDYNYRSAERIVAGAGKVISHNQLRFDKKIRATHEHGDEIEVKIFETFAEENAAVMKKILDCHELGLKYSDLAVLYRTNTQPRVLTEKLLEYNIPFCIQDKMPNLFDHWIAGNLLSYLHIACGNRERALFLQIINRPNRYISRECFDSKIVDFDSIERYFEEKPYVVERLERMQYDLQMIKRMNPYAAVNYIRKAIGYDEYLKDYAEYRSMNYEELLETAGEIQESARGYQTHEEWFEHIEAYKNEMIKKQQDMKNDTSDRVALMTFHASKGLEYDTVIIIDANEGIMPHRKAQVLEDIEEERRMFYVAMTRAKSYLHIYGTKERYGKRLAPSRFVEELLAENKK